MRKRNVSILILPFYNRMKIHFFSPTGTEETGLIPQKQPPTVEEQFYSLHHTPNQVAALTQIVRTTDETTAILADTHELHHRPQQSVKGIHGEKEAVQGAEVKFDAG